MTDKATLQAFYDKTIKHLIKQGKRSVDENENCLYRGPAGLRCAAGIHIPNTLYNCNMEHTNIKDLVTHDYPDLQGRFPSLDLAAELQMLHDSPGNWDDEGFKFEEAAVIAKHYDLLPYPRPEAK